MKIELTFEKDFDNLYKRFARDEKLRECLYLDGISPEKLDIGEMSKAYYKNKLADISVDVNANANEELSANNYQAEIVKGVMKLEGYYLIWRYAKKRFGKRRANELISAIWKGELYFHDASGHGIQVPYCFAYSTANLMIEGRPYGQLHSVRPERSDSFMAQVIETTMDLSQEFAGAVAPADLIVNLSYYFKREGLDPEKREDSKYMLNQWQKFIHVMNNKFRVSGQSPFTNVSMFDRENLKKLFEEYRYPDGSSIDVEYVMKVQKLYAEFFSNGDPKTGLPYRFPVVTFNLSVDEERKPLDEDFLDFLAKVNCKKGVFNIYANEGSKIAMCPLDGDTEVIIRNNKGIFKSKIGILGQHDKEEYAVLLGDKFRRGKFIRTDTERLYKVTMSNGHVVTMGENHLNLTEDGVKLAKNLVVGNMLPFNSTVLDGVGGTHELGYLVGVYLGDGCVTNGNVILTLNDSTKLHVVEKVRSILEHHGINYHEYVNNGVVFINSNSNMFRGLINDFTLGTGALDKGINPNTLKNSVEFRRGILAGYADTDGGNRGRIYTSSKNMVSDLTMLCSSLGIITNIKIVDEREGGYSEKPNYCVKLYDMDSMRKRDYKDVYKRINGEIYFYIDNIEVIEKKKQVYCFEMIDSEPYFQLANGIITHNCRFINDTERMNFRADSFGNGGMNIGSHRIVTINFPRLALDAKDEKEFWQLLDKRAKMCRDLLLVHREEILTRRVEQGLLKFFKPLNWFTLKMFFSTIGIHGLYEMDYFLGIPMESPEGQDFTEKVLKKVDDYTIQFSEETGHSFNAEEIPGESTAMSLARKDALFYEQPFKLYSNQYLPLISEVGEMERIEVTGRFMKHVSGGGIMHLNIEEQITEPDKMKKLILLALRKGVEHFAVNYGFGVCGKGHTSVIGNGKTCPICGEPIEDYMTRVIGYFTKVSSWGEVRREYEYPKRKFY